MLHRWVIWVLIFWAYLVSVSITLLSFVFLWQSVFLMKYVVSKFLVVCIWVRACMEGKKTLLRLLVLCMKLLLQDFRNSDVNWDIFWKSWVLICPYKFYRTSCWCPLPVLPYSESLFPQEQAPNFLFTGGYLLHVHYWFLIWSLNSIMRSFYAQ